MWSSSSSSSRDNWERLVVAVLKRDQIWQLCHQHSISPTISTISSDDFSGHNFSLEHSSVSPSSLAQLRNLSVSGVSNNVLGAIRQKLVSGWSQRRNPKDEHLLETPEGRRIHLKHVQRFSLQELRVATQNFSKKNLFKYGYNEVYKGFLAVGSAVAVKRYVDIEDSKDFTTEVRFWREIEINSIAAHQNVLHMLGFCVTTKERLLVYPLMVNGSVESCLRDRHVSQPPLSWQTRKGIALGAARGIAYLHYECDKKILHCDVEAENILLDDNFEAVVADFDLAKITDSSNTDDVSGPARETMSHIASEYISTGICSEKYDVSGYGVFLLELITGQKAFDLAWLAGDDMMFLDWVKRNLKERRWKKMVDPDCRGKSIEEEVEQLMQIVVLCMQVDPERRLKMSEVVRILEAGDGSLAEKWEQWCNEEEILHQEF